MANSNVSEILKIQTFTTFHFWKLWWLKNDQNASSENLDILGGYFQVKHDPKMTSGLLEILKEKIKFGGNLFTGNDLCMSKMSYEEGSYTFEAKHSKNIILSTLAMCFLLEKF